MIYMMGGIVGLLVLIFLIWYCARKRMMIRVKEKIQDLRMKGRPETLVREEIKINLKSIKFQQNSTKK